MSLQLWQIVFLLTIIQHLLFFILLASLNIICHVEIKIEIEKKITDDKDTALIII